jgi:hypothetical protein
LPGAAGAAKPVKTISLDNSSLSLTEGDEKDLTVQRSNSNGKASVTVSTSPGTATSGVDYVAVNRTLTFTRGQSSILVHIVILDDAASEGDETFSVNLSSPSKGYTLASPSSTAVTIHDEAAPTTAPSNLQATAEGAAVRLDWDSTEDVDEFVVLRATASGGPYTEVGRTTDTTFRDNGLASATTYYYVVEAANDGANGPDSSEANATTFTLLDNLEGVTTGWSATGLWHLANNSGCADPAYASATHAFYYGQELSCNFDTGVANSGTLTSPNYTISGAATTLAFSYRLETEQSCPSFDATNVEVSYDDGATWSPPGGVGCLQDTASWDAYSVSIAPTGTTLKVRFTFDTVDDINNQSLGWLIDDLSVQ